MRADIFAKQIALIHGRINDLYRGARASVQGEDSLLPSAFKELGTVSEELQVASEELCQQTEELEEARSQIDVVYQRYQELFESLPHACLVTDTQGKIQEANSAAVKLLNCQPLSLLGKLLINFFPVPDRQVFRTKLSQLLQYDGILEWTASLQPRHQNELIKATVTVAASRNFEGDVVTLRWFLHDITPTKGETFLSNASEFCQQRSRHIYTKGEIISLKPSHVWLVCEGLVKLTTINETGEEVLVGLVGSSMPFGSSMTSLSTYQATALSQNVELVCFPFSEIVASPRLSQVLLPQLSARLQQTESLLAISGKRKVIDRLHHLLLLLKQEIGEPVAQGQRLSVRLTHQDLADACCTTRVTITRLLNQLQKQGKISYDSQHHILVKEND